MGRRPARLQCVFPSSSWHGVLARKNERKPCGSLLIWTLREQRTKKTDFSWNKCMISKKKIGWNGLKWEIPSKTKYKCACTYVAAIGAAIVIHFFICLFNSISSKQSMTKWLRGTILDWVSTHDSKKHRIRIKKNKLLRPTSPKPWLFWNFVEQMRFWSNQIISSPLQLPSETILRIQWLEWHPCGHRVVPAAPKI